MFGRKSKVIEIDGQAFTVRELSLRETKDVQKQEDEVAQTATALMFAVVNESGNRVFASTSEVEELPISAVKILSEALLDITGVEEKKA